MTRPHIICSLFCFSNIEIDNWTNYKSTLVPHIRWFSEYICVISQNLHLEFEVLHNSSWIAYCLHLQFSYWIVAFSADTSGNLIKVLQNQSTLASLESEYLQGDTDIFGNRIATRILENNKKTKSFCNIWASPLVLVTHKRSNSPQFSLKGERNGAVHSTLR